MTSILLSMITTAFITSSKFSNITQKREIKPCSGVTLKEWDIGKNIPDDIHLQTEQDVAKDGHFSGFIPHLYNLEFIFNNETNYYGSVTISVRSTQRSKYLIFNIGEQSPQIDYQDIKIHYNTTRSYEATQCIANVTTSTSEEILIVEFNSELLENTEYNITFGLVRWRAFNESNNTGAKGLRISQTGDSYALFTAFYKRQARTVFPCIDHPSLKAKFRLTLITKADFTTVLSNTHAEKIEFLNNGMMQHNFQTTPAISTHSFGFVLQRNYVTMISQNPNVSLACPTSRRRNSAEILADVQTAITYMTDVTNFTLPWHQTKFYLVSQSSSRQLGSMNLVGLHLATISDAPTSAARKQILLHYVIHQWLGDIVGVKDWTDECLQEGLTVYLSWLLTWNTAAEVRTLVRLQVRNNLRKYDFQLIRNGTIFNQSQSCFARSPIFLHMIADIVGRLTFNKFLSEMFVKYKMGNAGIDDWDDTLVEVSQYRNRTDFFKRWFHQAGPIILNITTANNSLIIRQSLDKRVQFNPHLKLEILCSTCTKFSELIFGNENEVQNVYVSRPQWSLVDPDSQTLTRKVYESSAYMKIFDSYAQGPHVHLTKERRDDFRDEFCYALRKNLLPLDPQFDKEIWKKIFVMVRNQTLPGSHCYCCVTPSVMSENDCSSTREHCNSLNIVRLVNSV